jgi:hypothetical protein
MENLSTLAKTKQWVSSLPIGLSMNLHTLIAQFPNEPEGNLSAALSHLKSDGCLLLNPVKVLSSKSPNGSQSWVHNYTLISFPDQINVRKKPVVKSEPEPVKSQKPFRKAFACNPSDRFDLPKLHALADDTVYLCDAPVRDWMSVEERKIRYEWQMVKRLKDFDPETDIIVVFGDTIVFGMTLFYLGEFYDKINVARWSSKANDYIIHALDQSFFE